jgi:LysM repeat protein
MEGGMLPWRTQTIVSNCPDIADICTRSLPPPPSGYFWERQEENGNWVLLAIPKNYAEDGAVVFSKPSILEHTVMPGDTLQGICLRYRVSAVDLRRANVFSGNNIQFKTSLLIPINGGVIVKPQIETHEVILQRFKNLTSEGIQESKMYLEDNQWNLMKAVEHWKADRNWEREHSNDPHQHAFSSELPAEDIVPPVKVEMPKMVVPIQISLRPPTTVEQGIEMLTSDPACEPLLS